MKKTTNKNKGFTLLELLMVIAIFGILTSVIVFNYGKFTGDTVLTNMAYELALSVREAQTFGVAVRNPNGQMGTGSFENPYGINLSIASGSNPDYILFLDENKNGQCDNGSNECSCSGDECVQKFTMQRGMLVTNLVVKTASGCYLPNVMNINFRRPNPEPEIYDEFGDQWAPFEAVEVKLTSPQGSDRYVVITTVGQVYVSNTSIAPDLSACDL